MIRYAAFRGTRRLPRGPPRTCQRHAATAGRGASHSGGGGGGCSRPVSHLGTPAVSLGQLRFGICVIAGTGGWWLATDRRREARARLVDRRLVVSAELVAARAVQGLGGAVRCCARSPRGPSCLGPKPSCERDGVYCRPPHHDRSSLASATAAPLRFAGTIRTSKRATSRARHCP